MNPRQRRIRRQRRKERKAFREDELDRWHRAQTIVQKRPPEAPRTGVALLTDLLAKGAPR